MKDEQETPIWFFAGAILLVYGIIVFGASLHHIVNIVSSSSLAQLSRRAGLAWGICMAVFGAILLLAFRRPRPMNGSHSETHDSQ